MVTVNGSVGLVDPGVRKFDTVTSAKSTSAVTAVSANLFPAVNSQAELACTSKKVVQVGAAEFCVT